MTTKAKSQTKKVMIVEIPKSPEPKEPTDIIGSLTSLQASAGWAVIVRILTENLTYIEIAILEKIDPLTKEFLNDQEVERLRDKRDLTIELMKTPQNYIKVLMDTGETPKNYDPYYNAKELIKARTLKTE